MYSDKELNNNAFQLLETNFSWNERLINYLKEIQIFEQESKIHILNETMEIKNKLADYADTAEKWFGKNN